MQELLDAVTGVTGNQDELLQTLQQVPALHQLCHRGGHHGGVHFDWIPQCELTEVNNTLLILPNSDGGVVGVSRTPLDIPKSVT